MPARDPRIDAYIKRAAPFARPILKRIRKLVHAACPAVTETLKWGAPAFEYKGLLCGMAAFKHYAALVFWKGRLLADRGFFEAAETERGPFGRLTTLADLPGDGRLTEIIEAAVALNDQGVKLSRPRLPPKPAVRPPAYFLAAVRKNKKALAGYEAFSPSHKREYVEWVTEAKSQATRDRRLAQAVEWIAEGKSRNWKYT